MPWKQPAKKTNKKRKTSGGQWGSFQAVQPRSLQMLRHVANIKPAAISVKLTRSAVTLTSSITGVISDYITNACNASTEFPNYAGVYDLYRVVGMEVMFIPYTQASNSQAYGPCAVCFDPDSPGVNLTSVQDALSRDVSFPLNLARVQKIKTRCPTVAVSTGLTRVQDGGWIDTNVPGPTCEVVWYGTGFSVSTTYAEAYVFWIVEFKARL